MRHILDPEQAPVLRALAGEGGLLTFDFDGTLAPIVTEPESAALPEGTRSLLDELTQLYPCAVVSGRSLADLTPRLSGLAFQRVVGNHGLEPDGDLAHYAALVKAWNERLAGMLGGLMGVELEDKRYSLSVHYRQAEDLDAAARAVLSAARSLGDEARLVPGKCVLNVVPEGAPDKGIAVNALRRSLNASHTLYVGDDDTDEDVFSRWSPGDASVVGVRVGDQKPSHAGYFLTEQAEIDGLLARLVALRRV